MNLTCVQVDEQVMTILNAVLICRCLGTFAVEISTTNETTVYIVVCERNTTDFLEIEVKQMTFDCS